MLEPALPATSPSRPRMRAGFQSPAELQDHPGRLHPNRHPGPRGARSSTVLKILFTRSQRSGSTCISFSYLVAKPDTSQSPFPLHWGWRALYSLSSLLNRRTSEASQVASEQASSTCRAQFCPPPPNAPKAGLFPDLKSTSSVCETRSSNG